MKNAIEKKLISMRVKNLFLLAVLLIGLRGSAQISFTPLPSQPPDNIISIVTDPTNNDLYAAATLKVIRSVNSGSNWAVTANTGAQNLNLLYLTATGQLYAGADKTNTSAVGLIKYNKATNISSTPILSWTTACTPDSFRLQVATDSLFINTIYNQGNITGTSLQLAPCILTGTNSFYWRVYGVNAAGAGKWSNVSNFSTASLVSCINSNNTIITNLSGATCQWQVNTGTGFSNITNSTNYNGSNTGTLHISTAPTSWYGYQYQCLTNGVAGNVYTLKFGATWSSAAGNNWGNPLNWNCAQVPDINTDAVINTGTVLVNAAGICRSLTSAAGVNLTVNPGINFIIAK